MSIRQLPDIQIAPPKAEASFDLTPRALEAWNPNVEARTDEDVITIFDPIGETWDGGGVTVKRISAALRSIGEKPVTVQINSPGGNFFDGLAMYNLLRAHPRQVTVQIVGIAASAASIIAMAGDEIEIAKAGLMMIHNVQWIALGDRHAMLEAHDTMATFDEALASLYVDRTALEKAAIAGMMDATTFMAGPDAVEKGFATKLMEGDDIPTAIRADADRPPLYKLDAVLAKHGVSRGERRKLLKEFAADMPSAVDDDVMPGADDTTGLSLALARLRLTRP